MAGDEFCLNIPEQEFWRDGGRVELTGLSDVATNNLDHVVQKQTERKLKQRGLRGRPNQMGQPEDFGHLLDMCSIPQRLR